MVNLNRNKSLSFHIFFLFELSQYLTKRLLVNSGLINLLEENNAITADKGFLVRDLLQMKEVSLRSNVERMILKLKQFQILSGVIPLTMKPMLDNILFLRTALCNQAGLSKRPIKGRVLLLNGLMTVSANAFCQPFEW